jgi:GTP-binding protein
MTEKIMPDFTAAELEAGRKLFAAEWQFAAAAATPVSLPDMRGVEIAFAGRSNVGKSSLINALVGQNALARTSHTPGRTQELIFFSAPGSLTLVDMPGYGYAEAPKDKVAAWTALIHDFLRGRANLARVYVLVDSRHGLKEVDKSIFDMLDEVAVSYAIVLTKADRIKPGALKSCVDETTKTIGGRPAAFPGVLATSSQSAAGLSELRAAIARLLAEKGGKYR